MSLFEVFSLLSMIGLGVTLIVLGVFSKRLGAATKANPRYRGFYAAAGFLLASAALQAIGLIVRTTSASTLLDSPLWLVIYNVLPAVGLTIGLFYAWHYWSWLLAETT